GQITSNDTFSEKDPLDITHIPYNETNNYRFYEKNINDSLVLVYFEPIQAIEEVIAHLKIYYSLDYVEKENRLSIIYFLFYFITIFLSIALLLHILLTRYITEPVGKLVAAMEKSHDGLLGEQVSIFSTNEIGVMAQTFNKMSKENAQLYNELKLSNIDLEKRSTALISANHDLHQEIQIRKKAEKEAKFLRNYLKNVFNSMPSTLIGVNTKGQITQLNNEALKTANIQAQNSIGKQLADVFPGFKHQLIKIQAAIQNREIITERKISNDISDKKSFSDMTIFPLIANGVDGAVIRIDDVTNRVKIEEMMVQTEKMMSIGGLAAGMAHEINNPLSGILQNQQVISRRLSKEIGANIKAAKKIGIDLDDIKKYLKEREIDQMMEAIQKSGQRAAQIVRNMLSFARKSLEKKNYCSIPELLDQTVSIASNDYDLKKHYDFRKIKILYEYEENLPQVLCDSSKIQQVFMNILKNGAQAMSEKEYKDNTPCFILRVYPKNEEVIIEIEDNGPGLDETLQKRIFEPFFTTKSVGKGTGLGLSVSYFIIKENHEGEISLKTEPGRWTKFIISLPIKLNNN
ncbi:MAG: HAMP domain-containing protein, partial [Desulfobacula sp.]|nr:HAMP domain-containing protein [Desulfobacula sp.]